MNKTSLIGRCAVVCLLFMGTQCELFAWGQGHRKIREWAVKRLPEWQRKAVGEGHLRRLCVEYKSLQDQHAGGKAPHLDPYCKVPDVRLSLHDVNGPEVSAKAALWYLDQVVDHIREGDTDAAMKFLGVLCHWHEDPGCPSAHSSPINEAQLKILIPPPRNKVRYNYLYGAGGIADVGHYEIPDEDYHPLLLGRTREEIALRLCQRQRLLERNAAAHIVPLVQDMMCGDGSKAAQHRAAAAHYNARHIADVIHTVLAFAYDRLESVEQGGQALTAWLPDPVRKRTGHPYYVTGFLVNQAMDAKRNLHPLRFANGQAGSENSTGFGTGAPFSIDYTLAPGGVYSRFRCSVGLHETAGKDGAIAFAVVANGKELIRTKYLRRSDSGVEIDVRLPSVPVLKLSLITTAEDPAQSTSNLAVWRNPVLGRAE